MSTNINQNYSKISTFLQLFFILEKKKEIGEESAGILTAAPSLCQHLLTTAATCFPTSLPPALPFKWSSHKLRSINCPHSLLCSLTRTWHPVQVALCGVLTIVQHFAVERTWSMCYLWIVNITGRASCVVIHVKNTIMTYLKWSIDLQTEYRQLLD